MCSAKADAAKEWVEAVQYLGWLPEEQVPNDQHHMRSWRQTLGASVHLAAGFPHKSWPRSIEYFCVAKNFTTLAPIHQNETEEAKNLKQGWTCYETANNGEPSEGLRVPLGALVYYKPSQHVSKPPVEPRTVPQRFAGWRIDSGYKHRKIQLVLDYESLRTNQERMWKTHTGAFLGNLCS